MKRKHDRHRREKKREKRKKRDGRALPHDVLETYRFAAVRLRARAVPVASIAESFGVTVQAVYAWLKKARREGVRSLAARKAPGPALELSPAQLKELVRLLRRPASAFGFPTDLWSGPRVRALIKERFGVEYHPKHMPRFLRRLGLVIKFPERRALEQDPREVRRWKKRRLPEILEYARKRRALVFYADESLIALIPYVGRSWTFPELKPVVRVSGKRGEHVGVTAAVNAQGRMCFELTRENERFTAKTFLRFVRKLRRENPRRALVLIVDGAKTHKARIVRDFERQERSWFRLEILPPYSPELNPTERNWGFVKTKKLNACNAKVRKELRKRVLRALREVKSDPDRVRSFFVNVD